ncbi:myo-inositol-1(or 4)-monophosphatase [Kibdelosporangium banguiense]|uniref:Inositol-1-monophosphatase n=1 Tax=Kibdelosporangium banguiense TaxID=1365924 RepID=A0ABS4U2M8_9PSEU|nr:inositol monophosphatase family protein [Kibdelosporangium banguiense]MBP2330906.1 myo-inositol-1(or 4)-monophosphatase [Kibdelosporangium banguiense]
MWSDVPMVHLRDTLREVAVTVAAEAADLVAATRRTAVQDVSTKSSMTDPVTAGDRAAERLIRDQLAALRPSDAILGEEEGGEAAAEADGVCWVVDPIDGTVNYMYGLPWYSVSVAAQLDGVTVAGAVVEPASGRRWSAARGGGATLDGVPLRVSSADRLELALLATGFSYQPSRRVKQGEVVGRLLPNVRDIRRTGSAALDLCMVAAGWVDAYVEHSLARWDWAAGSLIAEEAGAVVELPGSGELGFAMFAAAPGIAKQLRVALLEAGITDVDQV